MSNIINPVTTSGGDSIPTAISGGSPTAPLSSAGIVAPESRVGTPPASTNDSTWKISSGGAALTMNQLLEVFGILLAIMKNMADQVTNFLNNQGKGAQALADAEKSSGRAAAIGLGIAGGLGLAAAVGGGLYSIRRNNSLAAKTSTAKLQGLDKESGQLDALHGKLNTQGPAADIEGEFDPARIDSRREGIQSLKAGRFDHPEAENAMEALRTGDPEERMIVEKALLDKKTKLSQEVNTHTNALNTHTNETASRTGLATSVSQGVSQVAQAGTTVAKANADADTALSRTFEQSSSTSAASANDTKKATLDAANSVTKTIQTLGETGRT